MGPREQIGFFREGLQSVPELVLLAAPGRPSTVGALTMLFLGFAGLQALDALTTLWFLQRGLTEANPLLRHAFHASPAAVLAVAKILSVAAAWWAWRTGRRRLLFRMNVLFCGCVLWNLVALGVGRLP